jgi:putative transcriptional regulator
MAFSIREKIASEITLSNQPGLTIRKWREIFDISQNDLAVELNMKSSVISDYEHGRRKSPGINIIRKIIEGLISIDRERGSPIIKKYSTPDIEAIIDIQEFYTGISINDLSKLLEAEIHSGHPNDPRSIYGYTIIDSVKAILTFSAEDYIRLYGWNSDRALIFTGVEYGRSPMIAIRTHTLKPAVIVYHKPKRIDPLAIKLAKLENIVFMSTKQPMDDLLKKLREM